MLDCEWWIVHRGDVSDIHNSLSAIQHHKNFPVTLSRGSHPFPSRTRKLSLSEPMVLRGKLRGRVGRRRIYFNDKARSVLETLSGLFVHSAQSFDLRGIQCQRTYRRVWHDL